MKTQTNAKEKTHPHSVDSDETFIEKPSSFKNMIKALNNLKASSPLFWRLTSAELKFISENYQYYTIYPYCIKISTNELEKLANNSTNNQSALVKDLLRAKKSGKKCIHLIPKKKDCSIIREHDLQFSVISYEISKQKNSKPYLNNFINASSNV